MKLTGNDAGLDNGQEVGAINLLDSRHCVRRQHDSARHRNRATGATRAARARGDRHIEGLRNRKRSGNVVRAGRNHHRVRWTPFNVAIVFGISRTRLRPRQNLGRPKSALKLEPRAINGRP